MFKKGGYHWFSCLSFTTLSKVIFCLFTLFVSLFLLCHGKNLVLLNLNNIFSCIFAILAYSVWSRFVVMFCSKQAVPNDQVNWWFRLLIKFHLIDERLECLLILLFMYAFYLLLQNGILPNFFFHWQNLMILCN